LWKIELVEVGEKHEISKQNEEHAPTYLTYVTETEGKRAVGGQIDRLL